jgi:hypothetical protein
VSWRKNDNDNDNGNEGDGRGRGAKNMVVGDASCDELPAQADDCIQALAVVASSGGQGTGTGGRPCLTGGLLTRGRSIFVCHDTRAEGATGCQVAVE